MGHTFYVAPFSDDLEAKIDSDQHPTWLELQTIFKFKLPDAQAGGQPPSVTSFAVNNGAFNTAQRTVSLNNTATCSPTQYMASESSSFNGTSWQTYSTAPSFTLSSGNATKTVYFKVKNSTGESTAVSDSITLNEASTFYTLTVTKSGTGSGTVVATELSCSGSTCTGSYNQGTTVTLSASASAESTFGGWSGSGCSGAGSCTVTMDAAKTVTATFTATSSTGSPDLVPQNITFPTSATAGSTITINWTMSNQGTVAAATSNTAVRITSSNTSPSVTTLASIATGTIAAGSSASQSATVAVPSIAGTYYVWIIADNNSALTQSNTANDIVKGASSLTVTTSAPSISSVSPNPVTGSTSPQTITIYGSNFVNKPTVAVTWSTGGSTLAAGNVTFVSSTQLQMSITTQLAADTWTVKVTNPDGKVSNTVSFTVQAPAASAPSISSVSPNPVTGSTSPQTITIYGSNFVNKPTVAVTWSTGGSTLAAGNVTFVSSTQLQMSITTQLTADTWTVKVTNPDGKVSNTVSFTVKWGLRQINR